MPASDAFINSLEGRITRLEGEVDKLRSWQSWLIGGGYVGGAMTVFILGVVKWLVVH